MSIEAMKQMVAEIDALPEGLEGYFSNSFADSLSKLRQAIEQAEKQEPVANIRTWHKNGEQHAELWNWDKGIERLLDGEHNLYTTPQLQEKPVALETVYETIIYWDEGGGKRSRRELARRIVALYTTPQPKREWVGLTVKEANELWESTDSDWELMKRVEAKLKEKNNG